MNVNQLVHPVGPPRYSKVSLPSISNILYDMPPPTSQYPPPELSNYYLARVSPRLGPIGPSRTSSIAPLCLPPLGSQPPFAVTAAPEVNHAQVPLMEQHMAQKSPRPHHSQPTSPTAPRLRTRNNLPKETTYVLLKWLNEHLNHPYPNSFEKNQLMLLTGLNQQQLSNWFINARRRKIKVLKRSESTKWGATRSLLHCINPLKAFYFFSVTANTRNIDQ